MTPLWNQSCVLYLLLSLCCGKCLDILEPLDDDSDDDTQNNEEVILANYSRVGEGCEIRAASIGEQPVLMKLRKKRSCELPEAAFIFKQVIVPESEVKTFTTVCREPDMMSLLKFQGRKNDFRWASGLSDDENSEESVEDNGAIFKEAIGFEIPDGTKNSKGRGHQNARNVVPEIASTAKSRLAHDTRSGRAKMAFQEIICRVQTVEKLKSRARRQIRQKKYKATAKSGTYHVRTPNNIHTQEMGSKKRPKERTASRPWQEKLWDSIRRSTSTHQTQSISSVSSYPWKFLHIKSRSVKGSTTSPNHGVNYHLRRFLIKKRPAESQPKANHPAQKHCSTTKLAARPRKGHYCHYHYKNHRQREKQAFRRVKAPNKQFFCTPHFSEEDSPTTQALDEDAIMNTLGMDLSAPTHPSVPSITTLLPTTMVTYPVSTHFQHVQSSPAGTTIPRRPLPTTQTTTTTLPSYDKPTATTTTESSTTSSTTRNTETATTTELTTHPTTMNMNCVTPEQLTTIPTAKEAGAKDDDSATVEVPSETATTANYMQKKRIRKS